MKLINIIKLKSRTHESYDFSVLLRECGRERFALGFSKTRRPIKSEYKAPKCPALQLPNASRGRPAPITSATPIGVELDPPNAPTEAQKRPARPGRVIRDANL